MTTKRTFLRMPGQGETPSVKPRIVIEVDPLKGGSSLKTYGPLSIPMVIDALMAQQASLWAQFIKGLTTAVTDPNTGLPAVKEPHMPPEVPQGTPQIMDEGPYPDGSND